MSKYFEVGVRYEKTQEDGMAKKVTETYLIDALSFSEVEKRITEEMEAYISGEFSVVTEKITNITDLVNTDDVLADKFYKVKFGIITVDEKTGKEKKQSQLIVVKASSNDDARDRYKQYYKDTPVDLVLEAVSETKYVDYIPY